MDPHLNEALTDAVRRWARPTTPEELRKRGVARVRSVSLRRVASLIEKAVNRTMIARTLGEFPDDAESFSSEARQEFLRLMGESPSSPPEPNGRSAAGVLDRLRHELDERRQEVEERRRHLVAIEGAVGEADEALEAKLRELFVAWGGSPDDPSPLEREVIRIAVGELRRERADFERVRLADHQRQIELLERRVAKLTHLLGDTEVELARAVTLAGQDPGVASMYEAVQGLDADDEQFERKAALMAAIFEANLELRAVLDGPVG